MNNDRVKKLAEVTGMKEVVIRACDFDEEKLTALFNRASDGAEWSEMFVASLAAMVVGLGEMVLGAGGELPGLVVVGAATSGVSILMAMITGALSENKLGGVRQEVENKACERLVALTRKDTGEKWDPREGPFPALGFK